MSLDQRLLRDSLGQFATGVCVVTASAPGFAPFGMTVNSFASVSLEPPLVLWSLRNDSECFDAFLAAKHYTVNVLSQDQIGQSNKFAGKDDHALAQTEYRTGTSGSPVLRNALCSMECETWRRYDGGDHLILVGRVIAVDKRPTGKPLVFHGGMYRELR
ncbi:conserved protein of DIM6/NTAB family [Spongiibacter sp. IMCC21906]|jgi:flavin reductase (DIM6/NTAB) family NADH-FMN oxidoreductase RutF|uniref:flavin reductase family protein n=1 Tax=Spongiibacter sp. IMCC21906 TaxID=1620392 RepID=UPI00062DD509|nr:flavin reductase family protein [Spongiibacter sp. IMCC21906]AKH69636.1 conserved protein of DIM6/NTAB family [Spongiibacter sp. IMCC21906]